MFYISNSVLAGVCADRVDSNNSKKNVFLIKYSLVSWIEEKETSKTTFIVFLYGLWCRKWYRFLQCNIQHNKSKQYWSKTLKMVSLTSVRYNAIMLSGIRLKNDTVDIKTNNPEKSVWEVYWSIFFNWRGLSIQICAFKYKGFEI